MLYTIGNRLNYLASFKKTAAVEGGEITKAEGGCAVQTHADALQLMAELYPDKDMAVYGLIADGGADTRPTEDGSIGDLASGAGGGDRGWAVACGDRFDWSQSLRRGRVEGAAAQLLQTAHVAQSAYRARHGHRPSGRAYANVE